jgi:hypothetical protein
LDANGGRGCVKGKVVGAKAEGLGDAECVGKGDGNKSGKGGVGGAGDVGSDDVGHLPGAEVGAAGVRAWGGAHDGVVHVGGACVRGQWWGNAEGDTEVTSSPTDAGKSGGKGLAVIGAGGAEQEMGNKVVEGPRVGGAYHMGIEVGELQEALYGGAVGATGGVSDGLQYEKGWGFI